MHGSRKEMLDFDTQPSQNVSEEEVTLRFEAVWLPWATFRASFLLVKIIHFLGDGQISRRRFVEPAGYWNKMVNFSNK